jgi:hypothetical protein
MNAIDFVWILSVAQALLPVLDGNRDECRAQTGPAPFAPFFSA